MSAFQTSRQIAATPEDLFKAIADPQRLARWWGPAGFSNTFHKFDFEPGGEWKYTMHGPNGGDYKNESRFTEIVPNERVVIRHLSKPMYELTITLEPSGDGTAVGWVQLFDDPKVAGNIRHIVEPANEQNLDRLAAEVAAGAR